MHSNYNDNSIPNDIGYLARYAIDNLDAEYLGREEIRPPFLCITGVSNTSNGFKIDQNLYPGIVAVGIDKLELNFGIDEYKNIAIFDELEYAKQEAASGGYKAKYGKEIELFGNQFMVLARGSKGGYEYVLNNGDIILHIMSDANGGRISPELRVICNSQFLWQYGDIGANNKVIEFLNNMAFINYDNVSRVDLCSDQVMPLPDIDRITQIVTQSKTKVDYFGGDFQTGQRKTGYQIGCGHIAGRFYNKSFEMEVKHKDHIKDIWLMNDWDSVADVSRFELQMRRKGLKRFDSEMSFATFLDMKADIWAHGTNRFIRIVNPVTATRKERAVETEYWKRYQFCSELFGQRMGVLPRREINPNRILLIAQARGCLSSAWAKLAVEIGDKEATLMLEKEWGAILPEKVIREGLAQKARFAHLLC